MQEKEQSNATNPGPENESFLKLILNKKKLLVLDKDSQSQLWGGSGKGRPKVPDTTTSCYSCSTSTNPDGGSC